MTCDDSGVPNPYPYRRFTMSPCAPPSDVIVGQYWSRCATSLCRGTSRGIQCLGCTAWKDRLALQVGEQLPHVGAGLRQKWPPRSRGIRRDVGVLSAGEDFDTTWGNVTRAGLTGHACQDSHWPNRISISSVHRAWGHDPFDDLTSHLGNVAEVGVVVKNSQPTLLCRRRDQEIRNLSSTKTPLREYSLHLSCS